MKLTLDECVNQYGMSEEKARELLSRTNTHTTPTPSFKVSTKGAVSVYGLGRWPVTLYSGQWESLMRVIPALAEFISANRSQLAVKDA
jgi:hypothetical protein